MKESYDEGVASHVGPESCLDDPRGRGEALTGESAGGLLSSEITYFRTPTLWCEGEGNTDGRVGTRVADRPGGVIEPGMCGRFLRGNREISGVPRGLPPRGRLVKARRYTTDMYVLEKSDDAVVPEKRANKGTKVLAEPVEGRAWTKRNTPQLPASRAQNRVIASTGLGRIRHCTGRDTRGHGSGAGLAACGNSHGSKPSTPGLYALASSLEVGAV